MSPVRGLTRGSAATDPDSEDPRLRGRAYAVPFDRVWGEALAQARGSRGWTVIEADARRGEIVAEARTLVWRRVDDVRVQLSLDDEGMTRVDVASASRTGWGDLGANARRIARFFRRLDRRLGVR